METAERHTSRVRDGERNRDNEGGGQEERERYLMLRPQPQINRPTHWPPSRTLSPISLLSIPLLSRQAARMAGMETFADGSTVICSLSVSVLCCHVQLNAFSRIRGLSEEYEVVDIEA
ncbi:Protein 2 [Dissostichus eleginoides]|uniref:Protein 2 n=1 Tax=Dissostichus eleginoides TaxID=100907 RepID=A0AAD9FDK6_DISEL|nr:Protein 2 [Dissostichus eleginoides]